MSLKLVNNLMDQMYALQLKKESNQNTFLINRSLCPSLVKLMQTKHNFSVVPIHRTVFHAHYHVVYRRRLLMTRHFM